MEARGRSINRGSAPINSAPPMAAPGAAPVALGPVTHDADMQHRDQTSRERPHRGKPALQRPAHQRAQHAHAQPHTHPRYAGQLLSGCHHQTRERRILRCIRRTDQLLQRLEMLRQRGRGIGQPAGGERIARQKVAEFVLNRGPGHGQDGKQERARHERQQPRHQNRERFLFSEHARMRFQAPIARRSAARACSINLTAGL